MYVRIARATGWTYDQIDRHQVKEMLALLKDIAKHPPEYVMIQAYFDAMGKQSGRERELSPADEAAQDAQAAELLKQVKMPDWLWKDYVTTQKPPKAPN